MAPEGCGLPKYVKLAGSLGKGAT